MKLVLAFEIDVEQSNTVALTDIVATTKSWLETSPRAMQNPNLETNEEALAESLTRAGLFIAEDAGVEIWVGSIVDDARYAGLIDWNHVVDRTRTLRELPHWGEPEKAPDANTGPTSSATCKRRACFPRASRRPRTMTTTPQSDLTRWESDAHASEVQRLAFDLDEAMGRVLHGATVKFERFNFGYWIAYLKTADRPDHTYDGTGGSPEAALMHAVTVCERYGSR